MVLQAKGGALFFFFSIVSLSLHVVVTCHRGADSEVGGKRRSMAKVWAARFCVYYSVGEECLVVLLETGILECLYFSCSLYGIMDVMREDIAI